jgi:signal transduction histidine kinase
MEQMEQKEQEEAIGRLADYFSLNKAQIVSYWKEAVDKEKEIKSSENVTYRQLIDHLPKLIEEICSLFKQEQIEVIKNKLELSARIHGRHRWEQGYDLDELLREFGLVRTVLSDFIYSYKKEENVYLPPEVEIEARRIITEFINESSISSARQFAKDREMEAQQYRTELEIANRQLENANNELLQINERLNALYNSRLLFTRTASHELRNILSAIGGATRMLGKNVNETTKQEMLGIIKRSITDMEALLDQLLDYSRLIAGQEQIKKDHFDIQQLAEQLRLSFEPVAGARGLAFEIAIDPSIEVILSDRLKIQRIINNLVSNAIKYTPSGKVKLSISKSDMEHFIIDVEDTGAGIETESLDRIFEEFQRAASSAGVRGTGLGLAITRSLVQILGGNISVSSEVNKGSRFQVILPMRI